jgi:hypothetical protein
VQGDFLGPVGGVGVEGLVQGLLDSVRGGDGQ